MKWFKHITTSFDDEKLSKVVDELGLEGYGFWWRLLEIIAEKMDESGNTSLEFSAKKWANFFGISAKKFQNFVKIFENFEIFSAEYSGKNSEIIKIDIPNLAKYQDNYTKNLQAANKKNASGLQAKIKIKNKNIKDNLSPKSSINTPRACEGVEGQEGERDFSFQEKVSERPDRNNARPVPDRISYRNSEGKGEAVLIGAALAGTFGKMADRQAAPEPPIEFIDLRDWYTRNCRPEGPLAGYRAYQSLIATKQWPGITRINDDLAERLRQGHYQAGYWPSLERYLSERTWESPIRPRPQNDDDRPLIRPWKSSRFPEEVTA